MKKLPPKCSIAQRSERVFTGTVETVESQKGRTLIRLVPRREQPSKLGEYYVIATPTQARSIKAGSVIEYTDGGVNFGWFEAVVS